MPTARQRARVEVSAPLAAKAEDVASLRTPGRLRMAMVVIGFPTPEQPQRGIFNFRAMKSLSAVVDVKVIFLRSWRPGRRIGARSHASPAPLVEVAAPQVPVHRLLGRASSLALNLMLYRKLGWRHVAPLLADCDFIYTVDAAGGGIVVSEWARRLRRHHIVNAIGDDVNSILPQVRSARGIAGWERHVHAVVCESQALRRAFLEMYPHVPNVCTLYRGVDVQLFRPDGEALGRLASRSPVRFLYLGGFPPYRMTPNGANTKGGWTLLAAWERGEEALARAGVSLLIAGPESTSGAVQRWRSRLRDPNRVILAGLIHPDHIPGHIRAADAVLVPSMSEGLPNTSLEASACARPVIGSDAGGIRDAVISGETGVLLPRGDVGALSAALCHYAARAGELRRMGENARGRVTSFFDSRAYAPRMLALFRAVLERPIVLKEGPE